jgi:glycosyltransferase involved in cell wall biosynthesis
MMRAVACLDRRAVRRVEAIFVENHWMESALGRLVDPSRITFAPPGVDVDFFHPLCYQPGGYLLSVGRFDDPRKNVRLLFTAYATLCRSDEEIPDLVLAGLTGPNPGDWAYAVQLGIAGRIRMMTGVSQEALRALYQNAGVFVLSSDEEGLGMVLLEAMACGLPVVATRCGGPETVVVNDHTGVLTPVGDAAALAQAIRTLLMDPACRERMSRRARQRVQEQFSLAAAGRRFLDTYRQLLAAPSEVSAGRT